VGSPEGKADGSEEGRLDGCEDGKIGSFSHKVFAVREQSLSVHRFPSTMCTQS
jgi:hypothetical protein